MTPWERISALMEERGTTNKELADFIQTRPQTITDWKKGKTQSYTKFYQQIAAYFGVSVDYLAGNSPYKMPDAPSNDPNAAYKMPESMKKLGLDGSTPLKIQNSKLPEFISRVNNLNDDEIDVLNRLLDCLENAKKAAPKGGDQ